jgi:prolyl-tRNA synthetase
MILRMSSLFVRTLRDDPSDAEVPSHRLLVRAGYIRRAAPGIYTWLPLGLRTLRRIEAIIREEMDSIGAQELSFPALLPREPYEATGRWTEYGPNIFRLKDRKGNDYLLGPTHEEMFTLVVKDLYSSYKDLPLSIYQIQTKYRDEARPRAGLLRGREFVMKDSYSFDVSDAGLEASYQRHRDAYIRIFDRLGFEYVIVSAMSGAMGGSCPRSSWPRPRTARTPTCAAAPVTTPRTSRPCVSRRPRRRRTTTRRPPTPSRRRTPRRSRRSSTTSTTPSPVTTGPGPQATRSRT